MGITQAQKSVIWNIDAQIRNFGFDFGGYKYTQIKGENWGNQVGLKIGNLVDPKEVFVINYNLPGSQSFKLEKINYAWAIKPFYGTTYIMGQRKSRMDVGCKIFANASLPIVYSWPVYISYYQGNPPFDGYADVQYDPATQNVSLIGGTAQFTKGMGQGKFIPGIGLSAGLQIEWGSYRSLSNSMSIGFLNDIFVEKIPLLYTQTTNKNIFPAVFVNFAFGFGDIN